MSDGAFPVKLRGALREQVLADYRFELRKRVNPDTGQLFAESEIALITSQHADAYIKADALDAVLLLDQQRALWLASQVFPGNAATSTLQGLWSPMFTMPYLAASGGGGPASAPCPALTTFVGSTTVPDPTATFGVDPAGLRYQVLFTVTSDVSGAPAALQLAAVDTGEATNLDPGTKITWQNAADTVTQPATASAKFTGGNPAESDQQFIDRLLRRIRHKQAAGNRAQVRAWAEDAINNAIESAFVFACAFHAGSTLVAITQKRGNIQGPTGRIPSIATMAAVTAYIVPPASPVMPAPPFVLAVPVVPVAVLQMVIQLSMPVGSDGGWADTQPWPTYTGGAIGHIGSLASQTSFQIVCDTPPPTGVVPQMMVWHSDISRFEQLRVASVTFVSGIVYAVTLSAAPSKILALLDSISPWSALADVIDTTIESYFDSLGPGEVIDVTSDSRRGRAYRFPRASEEYPQRAGTGVLTYLDDALGTSLADSALPVISTSTAPLPADPALGPGLLVAGRVALAAL